MKTGIELIAEERKRQVGKGYNKDHDCNHDPADLLNAAKAYYYNNESYWPWDMKYFKPNPNDRFRMDVKAGALIQATIERLEEFKIEIANYIDEQKSK